MASDWLCSVAAVFSVSVPFTIYSSLKQLTLTPTSSRSVRISSSYGFFSSAHEIYLNSKVLIMTNQRAVQ